MFGFFTAINISRYIQLYFGKTQVLYAVFLLTFCFIFLWYDSFAYSLNPHSSIRYPWHKNYKDILNNRDEKHHLNSLFQPSNTVFYNTFVMLKFWQSCLPLSFKEYLSIYFDLSVYLSFCLYVYSGFIYNILEKISTWQKIICKFLPFSLFFKP